MCKLVSCTLAGTDPALCSKNDHVCPDKIHQRTEKRRIIYKDIVQAGLDIGDFSSAARTIGKIVEQADERHNAFFVRLRAPKTRVPCVERPFIRHFATLLKTQSPVPDALVKKSRNFIFRTWVILKESLSYWLNPSDGSAPSATTSHSVNGYRSCVVLVCLAIGNDQLQLECCTKHCIHGRKR